MLLAAFGVATLVTACGSSTPEEEIVYIDPAPVPAEPVYTGKYK
jgi:hypothetical protein